MPQAVPLDRPVRPFYYALALTALTAAASCGPRLESIAPSGLTPLVVDTARSWVDALRPDRQVRYDLRWRYTTQQGSSAGRATVRMAPPDTLRFDYRGPFGKSGSALIIGDTVKWALPENDAESLVPTAPLFWAALGSPLPPPEQAEILGRVWPHQRAWRYVTGAEAIDFIVRDEAPPRLLAELRWNDRIVGTTNATLTANGPYPAAATIAFPREAAVFTFTVEAIDTLATFGPDTWRR